MEGYQNTMVKSVKMADIAAKVNVSVVTVSKALSGQKGVSEELRKKICQLADEMGYTPIHSTQKSKNKSYTIGVLSLEYYFTKFASFYWKMYQEVATSAVNNSCFTMLEVVSKAAEEAVEPPRLVGEERIDGIIIIGKPKNAYLKMLYQYKHIPMVFMDFYDDEQVYDSVISASYLGSYQMTDYLIKKGHKKIAYVGTLLYTESITDRYFGYCKALLENHIELKKEWILNDRKESDGIIGLEYEFELPHEMPTAFVCNNDIAAYSLIQTLEKAGYRVPEDISVVGYDNYLYPEFGDSKITTYAVDMGEMARIAMRCLIKRIENILYDENVHTVPGRIIERDTVKELN